MRDDVPLLYVADQRSSGDPRHRPERSHEPARAGSAPGDERRASPASRRVGRARHQPADARLQAIPLRGGRSDGQNGSVMVFDITDPVSSPHEPLQRPHAELNPFMPPDRLAFSAPVATLAFVQHDWPLPSQTEGSNPINQYTGLLCNPSPDAHPTPNDVPRSRRLLPGRPGRRHPALAARWRTSRSACAGSSPS